MGISRKNDKKYKIYNKNIDIKPKCDILHKYRVP